MVEFEIARSDGQGYYTEQELRHDYTLWRLYENQLSREEQFCGRIKISFDVGPSIYLTDTLPNLIRSTCSDAVARLASGREAIVNYCSHYGSIVMQPLNNVVFVSGDGIVDEVVEPQEKAYVFSKARLLDGLTTCYQRYQLFMGKWRDMNGLLRAS